MPNIDFYYAPGACSLVSHIALEEAELPFGAHPIALMAGEHRQPEYLSINPSGKVPTLVVEGKPLVESLAIFTWIDAVWPNTKLLPKDIDPLERARKLSVLYWMLSTVHPVFTRFRVPPAVIDDPSAFEIVRRNALPVLTGYFAIAAKKLGSGEWLLGQWSIADPFLFWLWSESTATGLDSRAFPSLEAHARRVGDRPAVQRALAREAEAMAAFAYRGIVMPPGGPAPG